MPDDMALGALSLSTTSGVQGRPFRAAIVGLTTGKVDVLNDGSPGFSTVNGRVSSDGLPYPVSTVVLREYEPGVGPGFRDTRIDITAATREQLRAQAQASVDPGRTVRRSRVAGAEQPDGSLVYKLIVEDDLGASRSYDPAGSTPTPIFTTAPSITGTPTVGQPLSALTFTDGVVSGGSITARLILLAGAPVAASYVLQAADAGKSVVYRNASGAVASDSQAVTVIAPAPSTVTYGSTQAGPGMGLMTREDGSNHYMAADSAEQGASFAGGLWYGYVTGSEVLLTATQGASGRAAELIRRSIDGGAFSDAGLKSGDTRYQLVADGPVARRLVQFRVHPSYGDDIRMPKAGFITATGAPPAIEVPAGRRLCGVTGVPYLTFTKATDRSGFPPARIPETTYATTGANPSSTAVIARGSRLGIESTARRVWYAKSGSAPTLIDRGSIGARASVIDVDADATYHVWTGDRGTLGVSGFGAIPDVPTLSWLTVVGDSFIEGAPIGDPGAVDTFIVASKMGRLGGNFGLGGETSVGGASRLPGVLTNLGTPPANAVLVLAWGQNDASLSAADRKTAYKALAQAGVDAGYALVLLRGTIDAPPIGQSPSNQPIIDAVSELANAKVKYIDPSTWTGIARIADGHPSAAGYITLAGYAEAAYRAAGA